MCEEFYRKNDFKLNILGSFVKDHMVKHIIDLQDCVSGDSISKLATHEEKDRAFLECRSKWTQNLRDNVSQELEMKARTLLGRANAQ